MESRSSAGSLRAIALACCLAAGGSAIAQTSDAQRIAELERKLEQLTQRLAQIEDARAAVAPAPAALTAAASAPLLSAAPTLLPSRPAGGGIPIHAFIDVGYARDTPDHAGRRGGFGLGSVNLYMTPAVGERVKSIVELVFEQDEHGALMIDLERVQLGYTLSDALTLWGGRFHTPFGYWNAAFHHGAQIQTSVLRPRFLAFEDQGGIVPSHSVGVLGSGGMAFADGRLKYDLYVSNGSPIIDGVLNASGFKDDDGQKMVGGNLRHEFGGALDGLTLGVHALGSRVSSFDAAGLLGARTRLGMAGVFAVFERDRWEALGEYYTFRNRDLSSNGASHSSWAGYAQLGYRFGNALTVYGRAEKAALDQTDAYFATMDSGRSYRRQSVGLRYELDPSTALKFEFARTAESQGQVEAHSTSLRGQLAVRF